MDEKSLHVSSRRKRTATRKQTEEKPERSAKTIFKERFYRRAGGRMSISAEAPRHTSGKPSKRDYGIKASEAFLLVFGEYLLP